MRISTVHARYMTMSHWSVWLGGTARRSLATALLISGKLSGRNLIAKVKKMRM